MSGDSLRDPVTYPNWMWVLGVVLAVLVVSWVVGCLVHWWRSEETEAPALLSISRAERMRYLALVEEIRARFAALREDGPGLARAVTWKWPPWRRSRC